MKIRILKNSLRFRLKQQEVQEFRLNGRILEVLEFGDDAKDKISFGLEVSPNVFLSVNYHSNAIIVHVPRSISEEWTGSEMVGFDGKIDTGKGRTIDVLVEKDFKCLDEREEDEGSYPNPQQTCA